MEKQILLIVNPVAGSGVAMKNLPKVKAALDGLRINYRIIITKREYDAQENIKEWINDKTDEIILMGGDGSLNEIINSLYPKKIPVKLIGCGTGNDLVKSIGVVPFESFFTENVFKEVNIFRMNDKIGINSLGIGFDGEVVRSMNEDKLPLHGILAYMVYVAKHILGFCPPIYCLKSDGKEYNGKYYTVLVANGQSIGGGFYLTPNADTGDDFLDLCLIKDMPMIMRPLLLIKVLLKRHMFDRNVIIKKIKHIFIKSNRKVYAQLDGQLIYNDEFRVDILPNKYKIIATIIN